jgi:hypothetical protein
MDTIHATRADDLTGQTPFDVIINCAGDFDSLPPAHRILTPLFDQAPSELGALEALLDGRDVTIGVFEGSGLGRVVSSGTVACESRKVVTRALNNVCSRVGDLVLKALKTKSAAPSAGAVPVNPRVLDLKGLSSAAAVRSLVNRVALKLAWRLTRVSTASDHWNIGWRNVLGPSLIDSAGPQTGSFNLLRDDGRRYYADPAVFRHQGQYYLFMEEYPLQTGKGVISVSKMGENGLFGIPGVIMEGAGHLSYPMIFEDDGQIFMVPNRRPTEP